MQAHRACTPCLCPETELAAALPAKRCQPILLPASELAIGQGGLQVAFDYDAWVDASTKRQTMHELTQAQRGKPC
eukprot:1156865-Pelagomonas_calceolata.AAC.13